MFLSTGSSYKLGFHYSKPAAHKVSSAVFILHSLFFLKYWWISYFTFILRKRPNFEMKNSHFKVLFLKGDYSASLHSSFLTAESGKLILLYPSFKNARKNFVGLCRKLRQSKSNCFVFHRYLSAPNLVEVVTGAVLYWFKNCYDVRREFRCIWIFLGCTASQLKNNSKTIH